MIRKAWYVCCDRCHNPHEISTESAAEARRLAKHQACFRLKGDESRRMEDVCIECLTETERKRIGAPEHRWQVQ